MQSNKLLDRLFEWDLKKSISIINEQTYLHNKKNKFKVSSPIIWFKYIQMSRLEKSITMQMWWILDILQQVEKLYFVHA